MKSVSKNLGIETPLWINMSEASRVLGLPVGRYKILKRLRQEGILWDGNIPDERYVISGHYRLELKQHVNHLGKFIRWSVGTLVSPKGLEQIKELFKKTTF